MGEKVENSLRKKRSDPQRKESCDGRVARNESEGDHGLVEAPTRAYYLDPVEGKPASDGCARGKDKPASDGCAPEECKPASDGLAPGEDIPATDGLVGRLSQIK